MKKSHLLFPIFFFITVTSTIYAQEISNLDEQNLTVEKLTRQKDYLRTRIYEIVGENKKLEEKVKQFEDKANAYDEVVAKDQKTISELNVAKDQLEHDMKALQQENNGLLGSLEDKENFIQNVRENIEKEILAAKKQLSDELEQKNQQLEAVQHQLKESQESLSKMQIQYSLAQEASANIQKEKETVDEKNKFYVSKIVELEEFNKKVTSGYEEQIKNITLKNDILNNSIGQLTGENKRLQDHLDDLQDKSAKLNSQLKKMDELVELKKTVSGLEEQLKDSAKAAVDQVKQIDALTEEKQFLARKGNEILEENKALKDQILKSTGQLVKAGSDQKLKNDKDRQGLQLEIQNLKEKLQQTESRLQHRENKFSQTTAETLNVSQNLKTLEARNKFLENQNAELITDTNSIKENAAQISIDKGSLAIELTAQRDKYKSLENRLEQSMQEENRLTRELDVLKANYHGLEEQNAGLTADNKNKEASLSELSKNKESLTQELASFSERYKTLEEKFNKIAQSAVKNNELIAKEVEKARKPLEELNSNLEKRVAELTAMIEKAGENISELVDKKRDTEVVNRSLTNENKKISEKLASLERQLKSAQESFDAKLIEVKTPLEGKVLFLEEKLKKVDAIDGIISGISKEKDQLQTALRNLEDENRKLKNDLAAANDLLHETDGFLAQKMGEAVSQKDAEIKQLKEKLEMTQGPSKDSADVSLKGK